MNYCIVFFILKYSFFLQLFASDVLQFFVGICIFNILIAEPVWTYIIRVAVEVWPLW